MIGWIKDIITRALDKAFMRTTIHKTAMDVKGLGVKIDLLLDAAKSNEARLGVVGTILDTLRREMGEQHEALADRFLESTIETRQAFNVLAREMGEQHEALLDHFLENTVELRRGLDSLTNTIGQRHQTLTGLFTESVSEAQQAMKTLTDTVAGHHSALAGHFMEMADKTGKVLDVLTHRMDDQNEALATRFTENAHETRRALEALLETVVKQHVTLASRFLETADESSKALELALVESRNRVLGRMTGFVRKVEALERLSFRQQEALAALSRILNTQHPLPPTRGWAASPDLLLYLYEFVLEKKPHAVLEIGGGVSSLVIAAALRENGRGHLFSFDHDAAYAARTSTFLERENLSDLATIRHAPLSHWIPPTPSRLGDSWDWYTLPLTPDDLQDIDLLIVDGPPEKTGPYARYPALPALIEKLSPNATVLLDDTVREDETRIAEAWRDEFDFDLTFRSDFEKGLAILTRKQIARTVHD